MHKILICDDEEAVRESLGLILSEKYDLVFAKDGGELIQLLKATPDTKAILLDIKMPEKNGIEVLGEIRSFNSDIPVIISTGYQSVETAAEAIKAGACNYIVKPFETDAVLEALQKAVS
ncbi:MAG: response regulator [Candidatus Omnitrophica bacterium]|nr:response regulator [Candidatus Omnitrophota bacterium]